MEETQEDVWLNVQEILIEKEVIIEGIIRRVHEMYILLGLSNDKQRNVLFSLIQLIVSDLSNDENKPSDDIIKEQHRRSIDIIINYLNDNFIIK